MPKASLHPLYHKVLKELRRSQIHSTPVLVGVSGGLDSIVLLDLLCEMQSPLKLTLAVAHVHHGLSRSKSSLEYRNKAWQRVGKIARQKQLAFYSNLQALQKKTGRWHYDFHLLPSTELRSEQELREFRHACLKKWAKDFATGKNPDWAGRSAAPSICYRALAHHSDDLLETRLLRLVRGTGLQGLKAMETIDELQGLLKPLLECSHQELEDYGRFRRLKWLNDPSNKSLDPLRNWMRHKWIPNLEKKSPGAKQSLARSLANITQELRGEGLHFWTKDGKLDRIYFDNLSDAQKRQLLATYIRFYGKKDYKWSHLEEVLKRLDSGRKDFKFNLLGFEWNVSSGQFWISPL